MPDAMAARDALAEALDDRGWEVLDTFGGLRESPSVVVAVEGLEIDGERFDRAELTVTVTERGLTADRVEITDEFDLSETQRELLDDVSAEKLAGPELTVWEYDPGTSTDTVDDFLAEIREVYEEL